MEDAAQQLRRRSNNEKPPPPATPPPAGTLATRQVVGAAPSTTSSGAVDGSATVYILLVLCTLVAGAGIQLAAMRLLGYTWCAEPAAGLTQTSARSRHVSSASAASYAVAQDHAKAARSNAGSGQKKALFVKRSVNFVNNRDEIVELYWVGSTQGVQSPQLLADIPAGEETGFVTYTDHIWEMRQKSDGQLIRAILINENTSKVFSRVDDDAAHHQKYEEENGFSWINVWPRERTAQYIYPAPSIGHVHHVSTNSPHQQIDADTNTATMQGATLELQLETVSTRPKVFKIANFLSASECDYIIRETQRKDDLKRSGVAIAGHIDAARTSSSSYLRFDHSDIMTRLYQRGFELLKLTGNEANFTKNAESLQVLHYAETQRYDPHHDFFDPFNKAYTNNRFIQAGFNRLATLFLYLNDVPAGGETVFPKKDGVYINDPCNKAFRVTPKKGQAILFYNMLEDGNLDDLSLHGGCPVKAGIKWAANWWFWDPHYVDLGSGFGSP